MGVKWLRFLKESGRGGGGICESGIPKEKGALHIKLSNARRH